MIHNQQHQPRHAQVGDAWTDGKSFKRVLSRGGAWENVNLGATHPDEVDHDKQQREREQRVKPEQQGRVGGEVPGGSGSGEPAQGSGDDGKDAAGAGNGGQEGQPVTGEGAASGGDAQTSATGSEAGSQSPAPSTAPGEGVDGNGSPVV